MNFIEELRIAMRDNIEPARAAYALFIEHCGGESPGRVPGCDTIVRLAHRSYHGRDIESNAAREYLYRWNLALDTAKNRWVYRDAPSGPLAFGQPHLLGL